MRKLLGDFQRNRRRYRLPAAQTAQNRCQNSQTRRGWFLSSTSVHHSSETKNKTDKLNLLSTVSPPLPRTYLKTRTLNPKGIFQKESTVFFEAERIAEVPEMSDLGYSPRSRRLFHPAAESGRQDLNLRPLRPERSALSQAELLPASSQNPERPAGCETKILPKICKKYQSFLPMPQVIPSHE